MNEWERLRRRAEICRARYPEGTRICLEEMKGENWMHAGLQGTVAFIDDIGLIHVSWENGCILALDVDVDRFRVMSRPKKDRGEHSR